jgi:hypothetical protein
MLDDIKYSRKVQQILLVEDVTNTSLAIYSYVLIVSTSVFPSSIDKPEDRIRGTHSCD